jgi:hypothetical protein
MAAAPLVVVTSIIDIVVDPADPANNTLYIWSFKLLFAGPDPIEKQWQVAVPNAATKNQLKTAVNDAIIAAVAADGFVVTVQRILTIADIAG